ncbi:MAG: RNA-binding protein [Armatimonadota bacterium]
MAKKLYVGNLSYDTTEESLKTLFTQYGEVESVAIITDRDTGRKKGFGFVEMSTDESAKSAIESLNEKEFEGRNLNVNEAREKTSRGPGSGSSRGGYGNRRSY